MDLLTIDTVGKCNKPTCTAACGDFFHEDLAPGASLRGVKCTICGCYAGQHRKETPTTAPTAAGAPSAPADPQPKPKPALKVSATGTTLKASRSIFRDAAERRHGDVAADTFHPAKQSQVEGDLNPYNSKRKKRSRHPSKPVPKTMFEPVAASKGPKVSKRAIKVYTVAMLEGTKLVARKVYPKPDHNKLNDLADEQYVAKVQIPLDAAPEEINAAVLDKFTHIPAVAKYGFRVLRVKVPMVKVSGV
ncbi:hypothetical protein DFH08DRAFT_419568 [Mycena albidolilacea]|uniref:Uncharacterized protein n=1 Tax=Mycena albidolilacea TaxID=1033008 RepID=A0AAD6ZCD4_9AGAR|nr:hypothetical protein DFH08DRAFT_419568 [Mycena albidolilacea]